ncbi:MAG: chromate transporter [Dongiaceae bacterium]
MTSEQHEPSLAGQAAGAVEDPAARPPVSLPEIILLFARIGLTSFGGGLSAWLYREVVDRHHWLSEQEFLGGLTLSQILPGANVINLSIYIGQRLRGAAGSVAAVSALLLPPMVVVVVLLGVFHQFNHIGWVHDFLEGVAAAAIGLTISVGIRTARRATARQRWPLLLIVLVFAAIGLLRWPMVPVVLCLAPLGLLLGWRSR